MTSNRALSLAVARTTAIVGSSTQMEALRAEVQSAARSHAKVLITGETGVGKDLFARTIHDRGARRGHPFVTINCTGVPDALLETELFGYVRGSFTDAYTDRPGLLRQADGGTVLLDEVGETSARMQAVLLRFLETGELQTVGATGDRARADVRVIAATNQDLDDAMATGTFRRDLYYRLNVLHIRIPPLRERRRDIEAIADYCLDTVADRYGIPRLFFAPEAVDLLRQYPWPGNVRQLRNVVERLVVKRLPAPARAPVIEVDDLSAEITTSSAAASATGVRPRVSSAGRIDALLDRMFRNKESFWTVVYPMFSARDLTRDDLRAIVRTGLERTRGSYRLLVSLLNMPLDDYRRFLGFLRQHDCHVRFQGFRSPRVRTPHRDDPE